MTLRTHKMIKDADETDSGKLTSQSSISPACLMYFACDEGTGTEMADKNPDTGLIIKESDAKGSVAFTGAANSCELLYATIGAPITGTIPSATGKSFLVWHHAVPTGVVGTYYFIIGNSAGGTGSIKFSDGDSIIIDDSNNSVSLTDPSVVVGETLFFAVFYDIDTDTVYTYQSSNGVTVALFETVDVSTLVDVIGFENLIQINALGAIDTYGSGLYAFSETPSQAEVLANLETLRVNQLTSNKALPIDWITET